jgi:hypothetical protein
MVESASFLKYQHTAHTASATAFSLFSLIDVDDVYWSLRILLDLELECVRHPHTAMVSRLMDVQDTK